MCGAQRASHPPSTVHRPLAWKAWCRPCFPLVSGPGLAVLLFGPPHGDAGQEWGVLIPATLTPLGILPLGVLVMGSLSGRKRAF